MVSEAIDKTISNLVKVVIAAIIIISAIAFLIGAYIF